LLAYAHFKGSLIFQPCFCPDSRFELLWGSIHYSWTVARKRREGSFGKFAGDDGDGKSFPVVYHQTDHPAPDHEQSRVNKANNGVFEILDSQLPGAIQKAIDAIPHAKDKQVLAGVRQQIVDSVRQAPRDLPGPEFFPQSIPFYASTETFNYFRTEYPGYSYKEAALNPTNPRDRTSDWEADVVNIFHNQAAKKEVMGHRETPEGASLYFCVPIRVDDESCLNCHSTPERAPVEMVKLYGTTNGFGWKANEVIGAQIISVPEKLADESAGNRLKTIMIWLAAVFAVVFFGANLGAALFCARSRS
jgi:hypothetical protein